MVRQVSCSKKGKAIRKREITRINFPEEEQDNIVSYSEFYDGLRYLKNEKGGFDHSK
jgi:hypothetical protein